jgi:peptidoglycan/LPS O-acetylase OafA/YrhL
LETVGIKRFYWLDILRGVAALSVVLWHWQHFFYTESLDVMMYKILDKSHYPLYKLLRPFYGQGWRAVELFFTLSGFIFFWIYSERILENKVKFSNYMVLRVSRLYPLHLLTLSAVVILQLFFHHHSGQYFIYSNFNLLTFFANLTLTYNWFSSGFSFNGPSWSLSVEMLLYILFFLFFKLKLRQWWYLILMAFAGFMLKGNSIFDSVGVGILSFFVGGITYNIYKWQVQSWNKKQRIVFSILVMPAALVAAVAYRYIVKGDLPPLFFELCMFPLIILTIALLETTLGEGFGKKMASIGDISYSSYLWHFPLQLAFVLTTDVLGISRSIYYSPYILLLFYIILIIISKLSYSKFEKPAQIYLRNKLGGYKKA